MSQTTTEVLNHRAIADRIRRIAWQIYEDHMDEEEIILAGIVERGYGFAKHIANVLQDISEIRIVLVKLKVNKKDPLSEEPGVNSDLDFTGKTIVVVDDVLNSGSTLIYGVRYFLDYKVKGIKTAVLVDRSHKNFPIKGDYKGISLSTNMMEHVQVQLDKKPYSVTVS